LSLPFKTPRFRKPRRPGRLRRLERLGRPKKLESLPLEQSVPGRHSVPTRCQHLEYQEPHTPSQFIQPKNRSRLKSPESRPESRRPKSPENQPKNRRPESCRLSRLKYRLNNKPKIRFYPSPYKPFTKPLTRSEVSKPKALFLR